MLTTSAFGPVVQDGVSGAWEPLGFYRRLRNANVRCSPAPSYVRTNAGRFGAAIELLRRYLFIPDLQITWLPAAFWRALRLLQQSPDDILFSTFPPASSHLLALLLRRCTNMPWVADFRDSWTFDPLDNVLQELPFRNRIEKRMEARVVRVADLVVVSTDIAAEYLRETYPDRADAIVVVTNGFDPCDFPPATPPDRNDPMRIAHTGSFASSHAARSPQTIFGALQLLLEQDPHWVRRLRLELYGQLNTAERHAAQSLCEAGMVQLYGHCSHEQVLRVQQEADLLLLVDHPRLHPASNVPTKFYEYLGARRPILAVCGTGMVSRLIERTSAGWCVSHGDSKGAAAAIAEAYHRRSQGYHLTTPETVLGPFHRRFLAKQLAAHFDSVLDNRGRM